MGYREQDDQKAKVDRADTGKGHKAVAPTSRGFPANCRPTTHRRFNARQKIWLKLVGPTGEQR